MKRPDGGVTGHIIHVDRFGNVVTDITRDLLPRGRFSVEVGETMVSRHVPYYAEAEKDEIVSLINSSGHLELAMGNVRASDRMSVRRIETVEVLPA